MSREIPTDVPPALLYARAEAGLYSRDAVITWIDDKIAHDEAPDERLLEISAAGREHIVDFLALLRAWTGPAEARDVTSAQIASVHARFCAAKLELHGAIRELATLYHMGDDSGLSHDELAAISHLEDAHDLAVASIHGSVDDVGAELRAFTEPFWNAHQVRGSTST